MGERNKDSNIGEKKGINYNLMHTSRGSKLIDLYVAFVCALHMLACMAQVFKSHIYACVVYASCRID